MATSTLSVKLALSGASEVSAGIARMAAESRVALAGMAGAASGIAAALAGIAGFAGFTALIAGSVQFNASLEQNTQAFATLLGSMDVAKARMAELFDFSAHTPYQMAEVVAANRELEAVTGGVLSDVKGMRLVGDAASAVGAPLQEAAMWVGRLYSELRNGEPIGRTIRSLELMGMVSGSDAKELQYFNAEAHSMKDSLSELDKVFGRLSGAMEAQSQTFTGLLSTFKDVSIMALADSFKFVFDWLKDGLNAAIPLVVRLGEAASQTVQVIRDAYRDGNLPEIIGLLIEAGFELGRFAAMNIWQSLVDWLSNSGLWQGIANAIITSVDGAMKAIFNGIYSVAEFLAGAIISQFKDATSGIMMISKFLIDNIASVVNYYIDAWNTVFDTSFKPITPTVDSSKFDAFFDRAQAALKETANDSRAWMTGFWDDATNAWRSVLGIGTATVGWGEALERVKKLMADVAARSEAAKPKGVPHANRDDGVVDTFRLKDVERSTGEALLKLEEQRLAIEHSLTLTEAEKWGLKKANLETEIAYLQEVVGLLNDKIALERDPEKRDALIAKRDAYQRNVVTDQGKIGGLGADPNSIVEQMQVAITGLRNQFGTLATEIAGLFKNTIGTAVNSISGGITSVIMGTDNWAHALRRVTTAIETEVVNGIVKMAVQWVLQHTVMAAASSLFRAQEVAGTAASTGAQVAIHSSGESAKTGATFFGALGRGAIRLGETISHGIMVGIRVAAHLAGEVAMTAITIVQSGIRIGAIIAEALANVVVAAVEALAALSSIPYVGPVLGLAAMAAVLGAGYGLVSSIGKREAGGPVSAGQPYIVGERGPELFTPGLSGSIVPAHVTRQILAGNVSVRDAAQAGTTIASRGPRQGSATAGGSTSHEFAFFLNPNDMAKHLQSHMNATAANLWDKRAYRFTKKA